MSMNIVVLRERMKGEGRVALTPDHCFQPKTLGHKVFVESGAGEKSGYRDSSYFYRGAEIVSVSQKIIPLLESPDTLVLKVKQPLPEDDVWLKHMKNGILIAYFHSTGEKDRHTIDALLAQNITAVSYENIEVNGTYPLLVPMSEIAGRLAAQDGMKFFSRKDKQYIQMTVIGAGTVGSAAIKKGLSLGFSSIAVFEKSREKVQLLCQTLTEAEIDRVKIFFADDPRYETAKIRFIRNADLLVGAVLVPGRHAPLVVSREEVKSMSRGSVIVDVACDQGGCIWYPEEMSECATFEWEGKFFCRTPNMPGSVPYQSTPILIKAVFPYLLDVLDGGAEAGFRKNIALRKGILTHGGKVMNEKAAAYWGENYTDPDTVFGS